MKTEVFREIIKQREYVEEISYGEWADGIEVCCKQEISILSEDIPGTISPAGALSVRPVLFQR